MDITAKLGPIVAGSEKLCKRVIKPIMAEKKLDMTVDIIANRRS